MSGWHPLAQRAATLVAQRWDRQEKEIEPRSAAERVASSVVLSFAAAFVNTFMKKDNDITVSFLYYHLDGDRMANTV